MNTIQLQISDTLLSQLRDLAARENVSVDQFASAAVAEKVAALSDMEYLEQRAARGSREKFLRAMRKVPHVPPIAPDEPSPRQ
jgi:hypothetical protein